MSSFGETTAKHLDCQSLPQLIPLQTNPMFFLLGHSHSALGNLLMVVSQLDTLIVPSGRSVRKELMVKEETP